MENSGWTLGSELMLPQNVVAIAYFSPMMSLSTDALSLRDRAQPDADPGQIGLRDR